MKKLLLSLFVCVVGFVSFGYCGIVLEQYDYTASAGNNGFDLPVGYDYFCLTPNEEGCYLEYNAGVNPEGNSTLRFMGTGNFLGVCSSAGMGFYVRKSCSIRVSLFTSDEYTSQQCQTEYNLIPVEAVDINYCVANQLCPAYDLSGGISELFINDIQHNSAPLININIPEEFDWDYTGNDEEFLLDVKGYNVDTEYISSIITAQNSKPNNIDFNNIVSGLIPLLVPGLVLIAFIYFVFRFVKKIF